MNIFKFKTKLINNNQPIDEDDSTFASSIVVGQLTKAKLRWRLLPSHFRYWILAGCFTLIILLSGAWLLLLNKTALSKLGLLSSPTPSNSQQGTTTNQGSGGGTTPANHSPIPANKSSNPSNGSQSSGGTSSGGSQSSGGTSSGGSQSSGGSSSPGGGSNPPPNPPPPPSYDPQQWLISDGAYSQLMASDPVTANWFFSNSQDWVMSANGQNIGSASSVANYKSYAQFASDIANGSIPNSDHWVLYDDESWSYTPLNEQQHPTVYLKDFADLAHSHGYKVIETPARDLMSVQGADCNQSTTGASSEDAAYLDCNIAAAAQYANVLDIQAQGDQENLPQYDYFVTSALQQVRAANPNITVIAGLTSYRGFSASSIVSAWQSIKSTVQGYWMNIDTSVSSSVTVGQQALDTIRGDEM